MNRDQLILNTVNPDVGTFGGGSNSVQITVNEKGLVTGVESVPINSDPGGNDGDIQFNNGGSFGGVDSFNYDQATDTVELNNQQVDGVIMFTTPLPTFNNLSPLTTEGDLLTFDGTNNVRLPLGPSGEFLQSNGTSLQYNTAVTSVAISSPGSTVTVGGGPITTTGTLTVDLPATGVTPGSYVNTSLTVDSEGRITAASSGSASSGDQCPYYLGVTETYTVYANKQVTWRIPITVVGTMIIAGILVEV